MFSAEWSAVLQGNMAGMWSLENLPESSYSNVTSSSALLGLGAAHLRLSYPTRVR